MIFGAMGVYTITKKTYSKISQISKPRTGFEIYESLLGKPETDCVKILNYQDQTIPVIDYAIFLHFKTCPKELKRILARKQFEFEKMKISAEQNNNEIWFKPEKMGDSILVFRYYETNGNGQEIYSSKDSTEAYLKDIAD